MVYLGNKGMNQHYGRPKTTRPVQVQTRLPWTPRRVDGTAQVVVAHPLVADLLVDACNAAAKASDWVPGRMDSYNPRAMRNAKLPRGWKLGDPKTSWHAWGTAWDIFSTAADIWPPGGVWTPHDPVPSEFAKAFTDRGFTWGRNFKRTDTPHIEYRQTPPDSSLVEQGQNYVDYLTDMAKQGDTGADITALQFMLRAVGQTSVDPSGVFDSLTFGAVVAVQSALGLQTDGLVGAKTEAGIWRLVWATHKTHEGVVTAAYLDTFGRAPAASGLAYWVKRLKTGLSPSELWSHFWNSGEAEQVRAARAKVATTPPSPIPPKPATPAPVAAPAPATPPAPTTAEEALALADRYEEMTKELRALASKL